MSTGQTLDLRTNHCWFSDDGFYQFLEGEWESLRVVGRSSFVFKEKLKILKGSLKRWNRDHFGVLDRKISDQVDIINLIDGKGSSGALSNEDISTRNMATLKILKGSLKRWNMDHFGVLDRKISDQVDIINLIDGKGSSGALSNEDISTRNMATVDLWSYIMKPPPRKRPFRDNFLTSSSNI
ncbi:unnamed protein product [Lupinus luteus]|uniref:Uncharacterized protein n=1 Tax=Lupinus luteus TaxID=3873 RepID=A0AAV1WYA7_LUPLU